MASPIDNGYSYQGSTLNHSHSYLLPTLMQTLTSFGLNKSKRIFDLGCGNGSVANELASLGFNVIGVDPSGDGIKQAQMSYPALKLELGSTDDRLHDTYGSFPVVYSLEVVEHVYSPRRYAAAIHDLVEPGGIAVISTPYHGYAKNLAIALSGKMDAHFTALWDHGHIKFWSRNTLAALLREAGFVDIHFKRVGRIPPLAKSMIAVATRPKQQSAAA